MSASKPAFFATDRRMQNKDLNTEFLEQTPGIYRLTVPFESVYTSVFLITTPNAAFLVDCATTAYDVDTYIVPALEKIGFSLTSITALVLTHRHDDHAGGCERILQYAPNIDVVTEVRSLADGVSTYPMAGHTEDCIGVLDERCHTLISGDGLQGAGVDVYRCSLRDKNAYAQTLERIKNDKRIENILFSHAYEPWNQDCLHGRDAVEACLIECKKYINGEIK